MSEVFRPTANESADHHSELDDLGRQADASDNPFEKDPNDSVDITAPYNDEVAQAAETELAGSEPAGTLEAVVDVDQEYERPVRLTDFEDYANLTLGSLSKALDNPDNDDPATQEAIEDQITVVSELYGSLTEDYIDNPGLFFQELADKYRKAEQSFETTGTKKFADANRRRAVAAEQIAENFRDYINSTVPKAENQNDESAISTDSTTLPGDVIS